MQITRENHNPIDCSRVSEYAFSDCTNLVSVQLHEGLKRIEENAFYGCKSLESITTPTTAQEIGFEAFSECTNLVSVHRSMRG